MLRGTLESNLVKLAASYHQKNPRENLGTSLGFYLNLPVTFQLLCTEIRVHPSSEQTCGHGYFSSLSTVPTSALTVPMGTTSVLENIFLDIHLLLSLASIQLPVLLSLLLN